LTVLEDDVVGRRCELRAAPPVGAVAAGQTNGAIERGQHRRALGHPEVPSPTVKLHVTAGVVRLRHGEGEAAPERYGNLGGFRCAEQDEERRRGVQESVEQAGSRTVKRALTIP
jgi:hypothetical protein